MLKTSYYQSKSFVVIGDTPKDVECAQMPSHCATSIPVEKIVANSNPDHFPEDLSIQIMSYHI